MSDFHLITDMSDKFYFITRPPELGIAHSGAPLLMVP